MREILAGVLDVSRKVLSPILYHMLAVDVVLIAIGPGGGWTLKGLNNG